MRDTVVSEITPLEYAHMEQFLYGAIFVAAGAKSPAREVIYEPDIYIYIDGFGGCKGDLGAVARAEGEIVGMAWTRIIPAYGHVDDETPELAISVLPEYRGHKIGTKMMTFLFKLLIKAGYSRTSLSVQRNNPAFRFYERLGYKIAEESHEIIDSEDYIMMKDLTAAGHENRKGYAL